MEHHAIDTGSAPITGNFEISLQAPDGAALRITGYVYAGEASDSLNERIDVCREALLRQRRKLEVPALQKTMEANEDLLTQMKSAYAGLLESKQSGKKMTSQELTQLSNAPVQIKDMERRMQAGKDAIAKAMSKD